MYSAKGFYYRQIRDMFFTVYLANISLIFYFFGNIVPINDIYFFSIT